MSMPTGFDRCQTKMQSVQRCTNERTGLVLKASKQPNTPHRKHTSMILPVEYGEIDPRLRLLKDRSR